MNMPMTFAEAESSTSGIGAFNINLKAFIFQLATFTLVLLVLRRWVLPRLIATIESRRKTLEESLIKAKKTDEALIAAEEKASSIIHEARLQADKALAETTAQAKEIINSATASAESQAQRLIAEAEERLAQEKTKLRDELKDELAILVTTTTEKVLQRRLDKQEDNRLIKQALKELVND